MRIKLNKINFFYVFFVLLLLINDSFFYLLGETNLTFIVSIISLFLGIITFNTKNLKNILCLFPFILIICGVSIIYSNIIYGQQIIEGIYVCHRYLIYLLVFFYLKMVKKESTINSLISIVINVAIIFSLIAFVQYFLYPNIVFFQSYSERNGNIRLFINTSSVTFAIIFLVGKLLNKLDIANFTKLLILFLFIVFVNQGRGEIMIFFISFVALLIIKGFLKLDKTSRSIIIVLSPFIIICLVFLFFLLFKNQIDSILHEINAGTGSGFTRVNELVYYSNLLSKSPVFGIGTLSDDLALKYYMTDKLHYYMEDTGVLEFVFKNGIFGLIWIIIYFYFIIKSTIVFYKTKKFSYFYMCLYYLFISFIGVFYFNLITSRQYIFMNTLFFSIVYIEFKKCSIEARSFSFKFKRTKYNYEKDKCC